MLILIFWIVFIVLLITVALFHTILINRIIFTVLLITVALIALAS